MSGKKRMPGLFRCVLFLGAGVLLAVQGLVPTLRFFGWLILVPSALLLLLLLVRTNKAKQMQKHSVAEFSSGDSVYETGFRAQGVLYDLSVPGAGLSGITFDEEKGELSASYSFLSRKGGREEDVVTIPVLPEEREKAEYVLAFFALPTVEEAKRREEEKKAALENEKKSKK